MFNFEINRLKYLDFFLSLLKKKKFLLINKAE